MTFAVNDLPLIHRRCRSSRDDRLLDECAGPALIQTINSSLKWLTEAVRDRGERLSAGRIILTGSIPSLIPIVEDCGIRVDAPAVW